MADTERLLKLKRAANEDRLEALNEENHVHRAAKLQRLEDSDEEEEDTPHSSASTLHGQSGDHLKLDDVGFTSSSSSIGGLGMRLLSKQGYVPGTGLGKSGTGRVEPVEMSNQRGRLGLGHAATQLVGRDNSVQWDDSMEEKAVEETPRWLSCDPILGRELVLSLQALEDPRDWMQFGPKKLRIEDETEFVDPSLLESMLNAKTMFDTLNERELNEARARANPYETIKGVFFQNRAAMKTANMDKVFDFIFSEETDSRRKGDRLTKNPLDDSEPKNVDRFSEMFYFADVCAGPGGFSEYMLWRKGFSNAKGFGFTLRGRDDFKLFKFKACSPLYFEAFYGSANDGNITTPANIDDLEEFIMKGTNGEGVNLLMADGGFSVKGQENIQEILSKRLYLCQLLTSLCIVKNGGNFFCKLFDTFTPFTAGLLYLIFACFDSVCIHKPHTSRPANSEKYIICKGLHREDAQIVKDYLKAVNRELDRLQKEVESAKREGQRVDEKEQMDVNAILPTQRLLEDVAFIDYLTKMNNKYVSLQTLYLNKYLSFAKNSSLYDKDQGDLRDRCLKYWEIPDKVRVERRAGINPSEVFRRYTSCRSTGRPVYMVPINDLTRKIPDWDFHAMIPDFMKGNDAHKKNCTFDNFLCTLMNTRSRTERFTMLATQDAVFKPNAGYGNDWEQLDRDIHRLPANTILHVEKARVYLEGGREELSSLLRSHGIIVYRVFDAAVINGDDIADLPYVQRMKCVEKMCTALNRVQNSLNPGAHRNIVIPHRFVPAKVYTWWDIASLGEKVTMVNDRGGDGNALVTEGSYTFSVAGVRISKFLKDDFFAYWSKSNSKVFPYAPFLNITADRQMDLKTYYDAFESFWGALREEKKRSGASIYFWTWPANGSSTDGYCVREIVTADAHKRGPTLKATRQFLRRACEKCERPFSEEGGPQPSRSDFHGNYDEQLHQANKYIAP